MPKLVAITAIVIAICFTFVQGSFAQGTSAATYPMPAYTTSGFQSVPPQQPVPMFEIMNVMHGQGLAAGNVDNNSVYLQDPAGRANARWVLISADNGAGNYYYIVDTLHRQEKTI